MPDPKRYVLFVFALLWALVVAPPLHAQEGATVRGVVTDSTDAPLPGVNLRVQGTQQGTSTQGDGSYSLASVPTGRQTIVASFVGYQTVTKEVRLEAGGTRTLNFTLRSTAVGMDEMVVTALGVDREERSLGYSVERVSGEDLADARETNVMESLSGKVAGLNVISGNAGLASTPRVTIRGESSLSGDNRQIGRAHV